ncbi:MAG: hypothetical protein JNJ61_18675 [Anaerolineae bacterium]|nr:hypothetical protein [Anaerolineae bacterium]
MNIPVKTTILLSPVFHAKLKSAAQHSGKPMGQLIEEQLAPVVERLATQRHQAIYGDLLSLSGVITTDWSDASQSIDAVVYGKGDDAG